MSRPLPYPRPFGTLKALVEDGEALGSIQLDMRNSR